MKKIFFCLTAIFSFALAFMSCEFPNGDDNTIIDEEVIDVIDTDLVDFDTTAVDVIEGEVDTLVQCAAITKKGTQCERLVNPSDTFCFQHKKH